MLVEARLALSASAAEPAGIEAATVPVNVMPLTKTVRLAPGRGAICAVRFPPTVEPANETSPASKPVTGSLKVTMNSIGAARGIELAGRLVDRHGRRCRRLPAWAHRS